jgi:hypothetical protein
LVDVRQGFLYKDGAKTDVCSHYVYSVALPRHDLDKINIKIDGKKLMEKPESFVEVTFDDLELYIYMQNGQPVVAGRASSIHLTGKKA